MAIVLRRTEVGILHESLFNGPFGGARRQRNRWAYRGSALTLWRNRYYDPASAGVPSSYAVPVAKEEAVSWETPEITDLGSIADHTFINPAGQQKPGPSDHNDAHGEPSLPPLGGS
jgi:hypothetical protein